MKTLATICLAIFCQLAQAQPIASDIRHVILPPDAQNLNETNFVVVTWTNVIPTHQFSVGYGFYNCFPDQNLGDWGPGPGSNLPTNTALEIFTSCGFDSQCCPNEAELDYISLAPDEKPFIRLIKAFNGRHQEFFRLADNSQTGFAPLKPWPGTITYSTNLLRFACLSYPRAAVAQASGKEDWRMMPPPLPIIRPRAIPKGATMLMQHRKIRPQILSWEKYPKRT